MKPIGFYWEIMKRKDEAPLLDKKTTQVNSVIPQDTNERLEKLRGKTSLSKSSLVSRCIAYALPIFEENPDKLITTN